MQLLAYLPSLNLALAEQIVQPPLGAVVAKGNDLGVVVVDDSDWLDFKCGLQMTAPEY